MMVDGLLCQPLLKKIWTCGFIQYDPVVPLQVLYSLSARQNISIWFSATCLWYVKTFSPCLFIIRAFLTTVPLLLQPYSIPPFPCTSSTSKLCNLKGFLLQVSHIHISVHKCACVCACGVRVVRGACGAALILDQLLIVLWVQHTVVISWYSFYKKLGILCRAWFLSSSLYYIIHSVVSISFVLLELVTVSLLFVVPSAKPPYILWCRTISRFP